MNLKIDQDTSIGLIGTGIMGASIASHLLNHGYRLFVFNRTKEKANILVSKGAKWSESPKNIAQTCQVIFTMLGYPEDVSRIYLEQDGLIFNAKPNTILIDMTSSSPSIAKEIAKVSQTKNIATLDAPVSGGDSGAKSGTLSIMVGGEKSTFETVLPLFKTFGKTIVYQGLAGSGQHTKLSNQILIASYMIGVCEAFQYAKKNGLNPETVLESVSGGAAGSWSLINLGPKMLRGDYAPGFYIHHFIKDMQIAVDECQQISLDLHNLKNCLTLYGKLPDSFKKTKGTQAIYELFQ